MKQMTRLILWYALFASMCFGGAFPNSGSDDIDPVHLAIKTFPTAADSSRERSLLLFLWFGSVQQEGADKHSFLDADKANCTLKSRIVRGNDKVKAKALDKVRTLHSDIMAGGTLKFTMGAKPSKWGVNSARILIAGGGNQE